jgi:queuine tRNA-ribosyltransferase
MGVGTPDDIVRAVARGVDMFDCVMPDPRPDEPASAFTWPGPLNLRNARFADDAAPLDADCRCPGCQGFSRAYLHHVVKANEIIASMLLTWHNLQFYQDLMARLRGEIASGNLAAFAAAFRDRYSAARPLQ